MKRANRLTLIGSVTACISLGLAIPLFAAEPPVSGAASHPSPNDQNVAAAKPAARCLSDLRAFDGQLSKDGHWLAGSGYGYGYPMGEIGYGYSYPMGGAADAAESGYVDARPGYEVRMLVASANILARHGQQQPCESVLATTRQIYKAYIADMKSGHMPIADMTGMRTQLIAAAKPVTDEKTSVRSDELIGTDVRNLQDNALGSVDDIIMSPKSGTIAYLVIARGGIFGIDEKYVPVPWEDFKITQNANLLVLDTSKGAMEAAPTVSDEQFAMPGQFGPESQKVDNYWKDHLSSARAAPPKG